MTQQQPPKKAPPAKKVERTPREVHTTVVRTAQESYYQAHLATFEHDVRNTCRSWDGEGHPVYRRDLAFADDLVDLFNEMGRFLVRHPDALFAK